MAMPNNVPEMMEKASCRVTLTAVALTEKGLMIQINTSTGAAEKASASASRRVVGVNTDVAAASATITVVSGIYLFDNSLSSPVVAGAVGSTCYVEDEHTVATVASNSNIAGKVVEVNSAGVYVKVGV